MSKATVAILLSLVAVIASGVSGVFAFLAWRAAQSNGIAVACHETHLADLDTTKATAEQCETDFKKLKKWVLDFNEGIPQNRMAKSHFSKYDFSTPEKALRSVL